MANEIQAAALQQYEAELAALRAENERLRAGTIAATLDRAWDEAVAERNALRAENERLKKATPPFALKHLAVLEENERLRAALAMHHRRRHVGSDGYCDLCGPL